MNYVLIGILYFILSISYLIMFPSKRIIPRKLTYLIIGLSLGLTPLVDKLFNCPFKDN